MHRTNYEAAIAKVIAEVPFEDIILGITLIPDNQKMKVIQDHEAGHISKEDIYDIVALTEMDSKFWYSRGKKQDIFMRYYQKYLK